MKGVRHLALATLVDRRPGYVEERLARRLASSGLPPRDRALATEIVLGTVRRRGTLDAVIAAYSKRAIGRIDEVVKEAIRVGLYQVIFLERVPPHAAVAETVEAAKEAGRANSAGFVNAVLRAVLRDRRFPESGRGVSPRRLVAGAPRDTALGRDIFPDPDSDPAGHLAAAWSHPRWLVERWLARHGPERTRAMLEAGSVPAGVTLLPLGVEPSALRSRLRGAGYSVEPLGTGPFLRVLGGGSVEEMPGYGEGAFLVQDPAQARVVEVLAPRDGERVLDLCAAPGTKTVHLARVAPGARVIAVDVSIERMARVLENERRLGARGIRPVAADVRRLPFVPEARFDAVLLDAPCSNTGVLARRVEARWRVDPSSIASLALLQEKLLDSAAERVAAGGRLVYSTCAVEPEEDEGVVEGFLAGHPDFGVESSELRLPEVAVGGGFWALLRRRGLVDSAGGCGYASRTTGDP